MKTFKNPSILLLFLFVLLNGHNPFLRFFYLFPSSISYIIWIIIFIIFNITINNKIKKTIFVSLFFIILYVIFSIKFYGNQSVGRIIQLIANISLGLLVINYYKHTLLNNIEIVLKFICHYSIIIWGFIVLLKIFFNFTLFDSIPTFFLFPDNETVDVNTHAIFHNFRGSGNLGDFSFLRNSGLLWEPGALSGTVLMLYLMLFINKEIRKNFDYLFFLVCITVFSTLSILGITIISIIVLFKLIKNEKGFKFISFKSVIATVLIFFSIQYFLDDDTALRKKVDFQLYSLVNEKRGWEGNRLGSAIFILDFIDSRNKNKGVGFFTDYNIVMSQLSNYGYQSDHPIGNGFFLMILQLGIYLSIVFFIFLFFQLYKYYKEIVTALFVFIVLILLLQGEVWSNYGLIYMFLFLNISINVEYIYFFL